MDLRFPTRPGELTRAEQKILDYINTNTDAFLFSSIGQLARRLELSDATVSRFARHVGCRDFKALKSLVLEQSPGPAVKWQGPSVRKITFRLRAGWSGSSNICKRRRNIWIWQSLSGQWSLSAPHVMC